MTLAELRQRIEIAPKLECLFRPSRYKVAYGGRSSAKSWSFARALLILTASRDLRVLCTREVQSTLKESVHQLLVDQIDGLDLAGYFTPYQNAIYGPGESKFIFAGLSDITAQNLKSFEGIDIVWIEEGQFTTKKSLDILTPTIRKEGSEIWISMNPELETDECSQRFIEHPPDDAIVVKMTWRDNPWLSATSEKDRADCERRDPEGYLHIWEGHYLPAVSGAIYYQEIAALEAAGRIRNVPYDPTLKVHTVWDLGWSDAMAIIMVQVVASEVRIIDYIEGTHRKVSDYVRDLADRRYHWGQDWLPHDGFAERSNAPSVYQTLVNLGRNPQTREATGEANVENGIRAARELFPRVYIDHDRCMRLVECLKRYRRHIVTTTGQGGQPVHDEFSNGADAFRYLAVNVDRMRNEEWGGKLNYPNLRVA